MKHNHPRQHGVVLGTTEQGGSNFGSQRGVHGLTQQAETGSALVNSKQVGLAGEMR